ncbi:hypothetical protein [Streptomyces anulatus]|uniref:hypothetical protein n=1 Tax=Streptomyces anulatus TaxID=1892 RepID=UPI003637C68B
MAAIEALLQRQKALIKPVVEFVFHEAGVRGKPYAVICPGASRVPALRDRLAPFVLFAASERERSRIAVQAAPGRRIEVLEPEPPKGPTSTVPRQPRQDGLTVKQAVKRMFGLDRM